MATLPPLARDALLPAAVAVLGTVELAIIQVPGWPVGAAIQVVACSLLVFRRRFPLAAPTLAMIMALLLPWFGPQLDEASTCESWQAMLRARRGPLAADSAWSEWGSGSTCLAGGLSTVRPRTVAMRSARQSQ